MKTLKEKMPRESTVETYLVKQVEARKGKTIKLAGSENGTPDRLVKLPGLAAFMVECKRPGGGGGLEAAQFLRAAEWAAAGMRVYRADTKADVDKLLWLEEAL